MPAASVNRRPRPVVGAAVLNACLPEPPNDANLRVGMHIGFGHVVKKNSHACKLLSERGCDALVVRRQAAGGRAAALAPNPVCCP